MNASLVNGIVNAVLYEGYMLYPYRPSAVKNKQRFNFGVVYPKIYGDMQNDADASVMQTECLLLGSEKTRCLIRVRFLRMIERSVAKAPASFAELSPEAERSLERLERFELNGKTLHAWQEAIEEAIYVGDLSPALLCGQPMQQPFQLPAHQEKEMIRDDCGLIAAVVFRDKASIAGVIELAAEQLKDGLFKLTVRISNASALDLSNSADRDAALARSLVSAHIILEVRDGQFISLIDPPEIYKGFASRCQNLKTWPVLVGNEGELDTMLSSPIILYDYPQIAPESPGDFFDGAEIDEILSLRIMTMTDEEKKEMRESDDHVRRILERTEQLPEEQLMKLHGALRGLRPAEGSKP